MAKSQVKIVSTSVRLGINETQGNITGNDSKVIQIHKEYIHKYCTFELVSENVYKNLKSGCV